MGEEDWYGPLAEWAKVACALLLGSVGLWTGVIGYDLGRKVTGPPEYAASRWVQPPVWDQLVLGAIAVTWGAHRLLRRIAQTR